MTNREEANKLASKLTGETVSAGTTKEALEAISGKKAGSIAQAIDDIAAGDVPGGSVALTGSLDELVRWSMAKESKSASKLYAYRVTDTSSTFGDFDNAGPGIYFFTFEFDPTDRSTYHFTSADFCFAVNDSNRMYKSYCYTDYWGSKVTAYEFIYKFVRAPELDFEV